MPHLFAYFQKRVKGTIKNNKRVNGENSCAKKSTVRVIVSLNTEF